ncbi:MAG: mechanosensitive ion channel domain-containing protein [Pseudomonadota bacterium]
MPAAPDTANLLRFVMLDRIPYAIVVIVITVVVIRMITRSLDVLGERFTGHRLLLKQTSAISRFVLLILATVLVAGSVFHFTDELLLAVGGSVAVAVGFAFKDLAASLMAGIILLFDRPFQVGDRVEFGGTYGEVREIGLRTVRIVTLDDNLVSIPNHRFLNDVVACANAGALDQMCVLDFWIGCGEDFSAAKRLVYEAAATSRYIFLDKPINVNVREQPTGTGTDGYAIKITVKAYVLDGRYETAFGTDITERAKRAFKGAGIRTAGEIVTVAAS